MLTQLEIIDRLIALRTGLPTGIVGMDLRIVTKDTGPEQVLIQVGDTQRLESVRNLVRTNGVLENDHELTTWIEYRFPNSDVVVHRSAHVTVKKMPGEMSGAVQSFGS